MKEIIFFLGPPGSGKGTQAKRMANKYYYEHVSTGAMIRALLDDKSATAEEVEIAKNTSAQGKLAPDWFVCNLISNTIEKYLKFGEHNGIIFDGAIRTLGQAKEVYKYLTSKYLEKEVTLIFIQISDDESLNRLTKRRVCGKCQDIIPWNEITKNLVNCPKCKSDLRMRADDNLETIKLRIREQGNEASKPILNFFKKLNALTIIDGMPEIESVAKEIEKIIEK